MKVILSTDVPNLGEEGDIKDVARGYARNFLIPQKLVMPYTKASLAILESRRENIEKRREEKRKAALDIKTRLESEDLTLEMPAGDSGRLFGSVTSAALADALAAQGISVERKRIDIPEKTIKQVGTTRVRVRLYRDEEAELKVVVKSAGGTKKAVKESQPAAEEKSKATEKRGARREKPEAVAEEKTEPAAAPAAETETVASEDIKSASEDIKSAPEDTETAPEDTETAPSDVTSDSSSE